MLKLIQNAGIFPSLFKTGVLASYFAKKPVIPFMPLNKFDPVVYNIIKKEEDRQERSIALIASENFTTKAVLQALGTVLQNKYSEGQPGSRFYGGNQYIDQMELLCKKRALKAYRLDPTEWDVNVQTLSGSPANFCVYTAMLKPHDRILALDLPHGGHISHGFQTERAKVSGPSIYFETFPYYLHMKSGLINYKQMSEIARIVQPKLIVAGTSAYSRLIDYKAFARAAKKVNAVLMADIAHISGLIAADVIPSPFEHCDIVTTTSHKTLRGPRGAMIFYRRKYKQAIDSAVFPKHQGGPHNHTISALAVALKAANTKEFRKYQKLVLKNARSLSRNLVNRGYTVITGGTETHLLLIDLSNKGVDGAKAQVILDKADISLNKNTLHTDTNPIQPKGVRLGTPAMTTRGFKRKEFDQVAEFFDQGIKLAAKIASENKFNTLKEFKDFVNSKWKNIKELVELRKRVNEFARKYPMAK